MRALLQLLTTKYQLAPKITMNNGLQLPSAGIGTYSLHGNTCFNSVYNEKHDWY